MTVPGSKSGTNRALLLAALAEGTSVVTGALRSDDCDRLVVALQTLGVRCLEVEHGWEVHGVGGRFPRGGTVDLGDGVLWPARDGLSAMGSIYDFTGFLKVSNHGLITGVFYV